jgi:SAM-dependent methyltransferase
MTEDDRPIALDAYERLAHGYAARAATKAENGYNEQPAMRRRLGALAGLTMLDAGCGPGFLVAHALEHGAAEVVGFDVSPTMVALARQRAGDRARLFVGDLAKPRPELDSGHFDIVASSLAIDYVRDWSTPLREFSRVLKSGGRLVMSVQHPMGSYKWFAPPSAFGVHYCEAPWRGFTNEPVIVPDFYRSVEEVINPVLAAGFVLTGVEETKPLPELAAIDPRKYAQGSAFPTFLILDARRGD